MPRTIESSTITTRLPATTPRTGDSFISRPAPAVPGSAEVKGGRHSGFNKAKLVWNPLLLCKTDSRRDRRVRNPGYNIRFYRCFFSHLLAEAFPGGMHIDLVYIRIRSCKINVFHAADLSVCRFGKQLRAHAVFIDNNNFSRLHFPFMHSTHGIKCACFRCYDVRIPIRPMESGRRPFGSIATISLSSVRTASA